MVDVYQLGYYKDMRIWYGRRYGKWLMCLWSLKKHWEKGETTEMISMDYCPIQLGG